MSRSNVQELWSCHKRRMIPNPNANCKVKATMLLISSVLPALFDYVPGVWSVSIHLDFAKRQLLR
jgi:hypothetical protein